MSLGSQAERSTVDNVVIFISDSLRYDALPAWIQEQGISAKTISASTYTGSSIPSLLTGQYPATHRLWRFEQKLPEPPELVTAIRNYSINAETIWTDLPHEEKPPLKMHHLSRGQPLPEIESPFIHIVHDKGGHAPYGHTFETFDSVTDFFTAYADQPEQIREAYETGVTHSAERFRDILETLEQRSLLGDTLVIFTSDHGELLGEHEFGRIYGHGIPMSPPVVTVPTVFMGAGLPGGESLSSLLSGVDVAPTALRALGKEGSEAMEGIDLWNRTPPDDRVVRSDVWKQPTLRGRRVTTYAATGYWTARGGFIFHRKSVAQRAAYTAYLHLVKGPHATVTRRQSNPRTILNLFGSHVPRTVTYGASHASVTESDLPAFEIRDENEQIRSEVDHEQLRKLGYLE